ncbi:MAG: PAS domain S-box protein, partial [Opitutaceae bacterium]
LGHEVLRVNHGGVIVPLSELQDKSGRPFVHRAAGLAPTEVYVSAFDLNMDNGVIELPFKPTLRFAVPVFDAGNRPRGITVINYLGGNLIQRLHALTPPYAHRFRLLNAHGYWISAARPEEEWGFLLPERKNSNLARTHPELWTQIQEKASGQARHAGGLFTWHRITARDLVPLDAPRVVSDDEFLLVASQIIAPEWDALFAGLRSIFLAGSTGLLGLAAISFGVYRARSRAIDALRVSERNLDTTLLSIGDGVLATDAEARITRMNRVAEQLTGWTLSEAQGRPITDVFRILNEKTRQPAVVPVASVIATGQNQELANHTVLVAQDGTERSIADSAAPIRDASGRILGAVLVFRDVSLERQAELKIEAAHRELADLRVALDQHSLVTITDPAGRIIFVNDRFCAISGYTREELIGQEPRIVNSGLHSKAFIADLWNTLLQGRVWNGTLRNRKKSGEYFWVDATLQPFLDADSRPLQYVAIYSDITELKATEEKLRITSGRLALATQAAQLGVWDYDLSSRTMHCDETMCRLYGLETAEYTGNVDVLMERLHREDRERLRNEMGRSLQQGESFDLEFRIVRPDGSLRHIKAVGNTLTNEDGRPVRMVGINWDITNRKRFELLHQQFRALFESLPGLYVVLTPDFTIVAASDAYLAATNALRERIMNRNLFEVFTDNPDAPTPAGSSQVKASLQRVLETAHADTMAILRYDVKNAKGKFEERYWSPVNSPVVGADGEIDYLIHRVEDVTAYVHQRRQSGSAPVEGDVTVRLEQMEAEVYQRSQEIKTINRQLQSANAELEAFSYSVSHDLRAPLRHIHGYVEMLTRESGAVLTEKGHRYLKTIAKASRDMGQLIDDLLSFSRMGRAEMHETSIQLDSLIADTRRSLESAAGDREIHWKVGDLPRVQGDPSMLAQVFANLLGNAVKYTRGRSPAEIEVGVAGEEDGRIIVFVRDNGAGFDMRYAGKLFGVFQRLHRADEFEGTGIGLANVRRIMTRHGGRTWAEGKPNEGATFYLTLLPASRP